VPLEAITAIHLHWQGGTRAIGAARSDGDVRNRDLTPDAITAFMVGMRSKVMTVHDAARHQRIPRRTRHSAILPGVALTQLWSSRRYRRHRLDGDCGVRRAPQACSARSTRRSSPALTNDGVKWRSCARSAHGPVNVFTLLIAEAGILAASGVLAGIVQSPATAC
jgi:hypothetical protein